MRDQYVGDISDLLKYALLRKLAGNDRTLGIAWYYNPDHDRRADGQHVEHQSEQKWDALDAELGLALRGNPHRAISAVEQLPIWPANTIFHRQPVPNRQLRPVWAHNMAQAMSAASLVFLDPDNGVGSDSTRHASLNEVKLLRRAPDRSLVLIKFPARVKYAEQERVFFEQIHEATGAERILNMRTSVMVPSRVNGFVPRLRWFTIIDYDDAIAARFRRFAETLNSIPGAKATVHQPGN